MIRTTIALLLTLGAALAAPLPRGMFALYEDNRSQGKANYITEDFLLLNYAMLLEDAIGDMEQKVALPEMTAIVAGLSKELANGSPENRAFLEVLEALLAGQEKAKSSLASDELKLIYAAEGLTKSPLSGQMVDYSQFTPRGKYTRSPELQRYFRAMRYAGTVLFPVKETQATGTSAENADKLTARALELAKAIAGNADLERRYQALLAKFTWAFGPSEDLTLEDLLNAPKDKPREHLLAEARKHGRQPAILSGLVDRSKLEPGVTAADALTGWRLFPSRYTPDSAALQALVFDHVTNYKGTGQPFTGVTVNGKLVKGFPRAAELMALLGSKAAAQQVLPDTNYEGYPAAREQAKKRLTGGEGLAALHWQLMEMWVNGGTPLNAARRLNTALAFFTLHRHANLLYAKQSYTPMGKSLSMSQDRSAAWIEPAPELYTLLRRLAARVGSEFQSPAMNEFALLLDRCIDISYDEVAKRPLTSKQVDFLNDLDLECKRLTGRMDLPLVADIHTETNTNQVLEEAIGFPKLVEAKGARGALFQHREFKQPLAQRLTDEAWQAMLDKEQKQ